MNNVRNVMHGMKEIAGQGYYSVIGLRKNGHNAKLVLREKSKLEYSYDKCINVCGNILLPINLFKLINNFISCLIKYDTFHFHFGSSLLPKNIDLKILKLFHKNVYFEFHGSDIRQKSLACEINPLWSDSLFDDEAVLKKRANKLAKYARGFIVHDNELLKYLPESVPAYIVPLRMDLEKIKPCYTTNNDRIKIVHAPSNRAIKGTKYINEAIKSLSEKYDIDYILIENMTQKEALKQYEKADIIIDWILGGIYGVFSIESMALGKPVITYITDNMKNYYPVELPIISASPVDIQEKLEILITNSKLRNELGIRGRKYVEKYHDCRKNAQALWDIYCGNMCTLSGRAAFEYVNNKQIIN